MRILPTLALALSFSVPAFCQSTTASLVAPSALGTSTDYTAQAPVSASDPSSDFVALREQFAQQNKALTDQVNTQRNILKKNEDLLKAAQKIQAANLKLADEQKKLQAQNADLEKQRQALNTATKPADSN